MNFRDPHMEEKEHAEMLAPRNDGDSPDPLDGALDALAEGAGSIEDILGGGFEILEDESARLPLDGVAPFDPAVAISYLNQQEIRDAVQAVWGSRDTPADPVYGHPKPDHYLQYVFDRPFIEAAIGRQRQEDDRFGLSDNCTRTSSPPGDYPLQDDIVHAQA